MHATGVVSAALVLLLAGCQTSPPTVSGETSHDGLVRVENARFDLVWVRPGTDFSGYDAIDLQGVGITYKPVKEVRSQLQASRESEFALSDRAKRRLSEIFAEAFQGEMAKSQRFRLVDAGGPRVLLVRGGLLDVVSFVPPEAAGRTDIYLHDVGAATLVLEISDSESGAVLARVADRRVAERPGGMLEQSNTVTNARDVQRLARYWAQLCRERLDAVADLGTIAAANP